METAFWSARSTILALQDSVKQLQTDLKACASTVDGKRLTRLQTHALQSLLNVHKAVTRALLAWHASASGQQQRHPGAAAAAAPEDSGDAAQARPADEAAVAAAAMVLAALARVASNSVLATLPALHKALLLTPDAAAAQFHACRAEDLEAELVSIRLQQQQLQQASSSALPEAALCQVVAVVQRLRELEHSLPFQASLAVEVERVVGDSGYSAENFAYGSTFFTSWLKVFSEPVVHDAAQGAMSCPGRTHLVWGSSSGWLVFFGSLAFGWRSRGYELLACLVEAAQAVERMLEVPGVHFTCADMLSSELCDAGVLVLTNQCWDDALMQQAAVKLQRELPDGAVVLEYTGALGRLDGGTGGRLRPLCPPLSVPVSWNGAQAMHVYITQPAAHSSAGAAGAPAAVGEAGVGLC